MFMYHHKKAGKIII